MKITFPHLGNSYIAIEALLTAVGHEPIIPPRGTRRTLELGSAISPEQICLPFKIILGNMLEGIELGATHVAMLGGWGPCRLGYYGDIQKILLEKAGREVEFWSLEMPRGDLQRTLQLLQRFTPKTGPFRSWRGLQMTWLKLKAVEYLENLAVQSRAREERKGESSRLLNSYLEQIRKGDSYSRVRQLLLEARSDFGDIRQTSHLGPPLKVGLVGEIYTVVEPQANLDLEERLGNLGVEVVRTISLVEWIQDHVFKKIIGRSHIEPLKRSAQGFLHSFIGGHGLETIAHGVDLAKGGIDGLIQILPLNCNPEIIAQGILPQVAEEYNIPIMSLVVDEHSGETGFQTRIEAFVDMLERQVRVSGN